MPSHPDGRLGVNRSESRCRTARRSRTRSCPTRRRPRRCARRRGVAVGVGEVDEQRLAEVLHGQLVVTDLGRRHRLHARRQRRVAGRDRVVVVEVAALLLERELVAAQDHRQHDVGLLEHLVAVDHERVEVEQQRVLLVRRAVEVPWLEARGRSRPAGGCRAPRRRAGTSPRRPASSASTSSRLEADAAAQAVVGLARPTPRAADDTGRVSHVEAGHHVRVEVVVDDRRVLVGTGDAVDVELLRAVGAVEAEVLPQPGRLDEDLGALAGEELDVAAGVEVALEGERDRRVDVVLRRAGGVVGRRLLAVDRAPRVQRAALAQLGRPLRGPCRSVRQRNRSSFRADLGVGVGEERDDVDLGVPEVVALVAAAGDPLGGDALLLGLGAGLGELEQVPADRLLGGVVAAQLDVAVLPELVQPLALLGEDRPRRRRRSARASVRRQRSASSSAGTPVDVW